MKIYLDVCCLNRPFDDQNQDRIRIETEAIMLILGRLERNEWEWVGSDVVDAEIERTPDSERRHRVNLIAQGIRLKIMLDENDLHRAKELEQVGFKGMDALHIACAERQKCDIFLSTDDQLLGTARLNSGMLSVKVDNPLVWLDEVLK